MRFTSINAKTSIHCILFFLVLSHWLVLVPYTQTVNGGVGSLEIISTWNLKRFFLLLHLYIMYSSWRKDALHLQHETQKKKKAEKYSSVGLCLAITFPSPCGKVDKASRQRDESFNGEIFIKATTPRPGCTATKWMERKAETKCASEARFCFS